MDIVNPNDNAYRLSNRIEEESRTNDAVDSYFPGEFSYRSKTIRDDMKTAESSVESNKLVNKFKESGISLGEKKISRLSGNLHIFFLFLRGND